MRGNGSPFEFVVKAFLSYWLSWYVLPSGWLFWSWRAYILHCLHFTWLLYTTRLGECPRNITWTVRRHNVVTQGSSIFLQLSILERFQLIITCPQISPGEGSDTGRRLEEDECLAHVQAQAWRWLNAKPPASKSIIKLVDKEESFCFRLILILLEWCPSYTVRGG